MIFLKKSILLIQTFLLIIFLKVRLSIFGFKSILSLVKSKKFFFVFNGNLFWNIKAIDLGASFLPNITCLIKCCTLKIISQNHENITLVIGVARDAEFMSHAWIEKNSEVVFGKLENQKQFKKLLVVS